MRQLTDGNGVVTLVRSYQPYGEVLASVGDGETKYSFTGEWADASGLIFLRARYYSPWNGRFLTRDVWDGNANQPISYNGWLYGYANPIMMTDPSGMIPFLDNPCDRLPPDDAFECRKARKCVKTLSGPIYIWVELNDKEKAALTAYKNLASSPSHKWLLDNGELTLRTVIAITYKYEIASERSGNRSVMEPFREAFARTYWEKCGTHPCKILNGHPSLGLIEFLGTMQGWYGRTPMATNISDYSSFPLTMVYKDTDPIIQGTSPTGTSGKQYRRPADWGNLQPENPLWLKNWIAFAQGHDLLGPKHIGDGAHEIWFSSSGKEAGLNNTFYILSLEQSGIYGLNCTGSCVAMRSMYPMPSWMDQNYKNTVP